MYSKYQIRMFCQLCNDLWEKETGLHCPVCGSELFPHRVKVSASRTPSSNSPRYPERHTVRVSLRPSNSKLRQSMHKSHEVDPNEIKRIRYENASLEDMTEI